MDLENDVQDIKGQTVTYSRAGGGAAGILLITFTNDNSIWIWCYWEIWKGEELLATVNDDITPVTGPVARAANALKGLTVEDVYLEQTNLMLTFSHNYVLKLFCEYDSESDNANWEYWIPSNDKSYTITSKLEIEKGTYNE